MTGPPVLKYRSATVARRRGVGPRREVWQAATLDGEWVIDRVEEPGTPWLIFYRPDLNPDTTPLDAGGYGTLKAARQAIATGEAERNIAAQAVSLLLTARRRGTKGTTP